MRDAWDSETVGQSVSYCLTVLLSHCATVSLCYCLTVLLSHCATVSLCYCLTVLLSHFHRTVLLIFHRNWQVEPTL
jgi:hypothetical protein